MSIYLYIYMYIHICIAYSHVPPLEHAYTTHTKITRVSICCLILNDIYICFLYDTYIITKNQITYKFSYTTYNFFEIIQHIIFLYNIYFVYTTYS